MYSINNDTYGSVINLEKYANDGRLTEPTDGRVFDYREMRKKVNELGRPLTFEEAKQYEIK